MEGKKNKVSSTNTPTKGRGEAKRTAGTIDEFADLLDAGRHAVGCRRHLVVELVQQPATTKTRVSAAAATGYPPTQPTTDVKEEGEVRTRPGLRAPREW